MGRKSGDRGDGVMLLSTVGVIVVIGAIGVIGATGAFLATKKEKGCYLGPTGLLLLIGFFLGAFVFWLVPFGFEHHVLGRCKVSFLLMFKRGWGALWFLVVTLDRKTRLPMGCRHRLIGS